MGDKKSEAVCLAGHMPLNRLKALLIMWSALLALMLVQKPLFMLLEPAYTMGDMKMLPTVMWHGLSMDLSMSAYLVAPVLLWLIATVWLHGKVMMRIIRIYLWVCAVVIGASAVLDAVLYPYWGFRLDATPLFYFMTSPSAAFASLPWWGNITVIVITAAIIWLSELWLARCFGHICQSGAEDIAPLRSRVVTTVLLVVIGAMMIIPIRGGVTVSTMSPGRAYFSDDMKLNHAAVNPLFNFVYSLSHSFRLSSQFRYMDDARARQIAARLYAPAEPDSAYAAHIATIKLNVERPDVYLIILESFSSHLLKSMGGSDIATRLDRLASEEGVLFTDFYAESFRTDRALTSILSGYPAMPSTSALRYINKFGNLPSLARSLADAGYEPRYYYGGDIDFTNLKAYLIATGFGHITSDVDFDISLRGGKWGVHDQYVYDRVIDDKMSSAPDFVVIQTSSSHEPYDVPYDKFEDKRANAFAYADHCLGDFIDRLKSSGRWNKALVVIVPDHWGSYPPDLSDRLERHHIPLVLTGGALDGAPARIGRTGSQSAIAPTIARLLGVPSPTAQLGMLDAARRPVAWMCEPDWMAIKNDTSLSVVDAVAGRTLKNGADVDVVKAFVQLIYDDLDKR